ncbi:MAG: HAMP domain-containing protein [Deltaproteobacteria bacterium]|nr:HAMP domain-containing protein [Deltaproteobacteria bacterium]
MLFLVGLGMLALAGILGTAIMAASRELSAQALRERLHLAQALADHLDYVLKSNLVALQDVAQSARADLETAGLKPLKAALREAYLRSIFTEGVFLLDRRGALLAIEPQSAARTPAELAAVPLIRRVVQEGRPEVSGLVVQGNRRIYAGVPVRDYGGELVGAVGGEVDPASPRFRALLSPIRMGGTTYLDLVDGHGVVLASTKPDRAFTESDHGRFLAGLIQEKRSAVRACHSCHEEQGQVPAREREVIAFAPLTFAPWGVSIRQAEDEAFAGARAAQRRLLPIAAVTILLGLLFAWGAARSVTRPLGILTRAAQRIAGGNLEQPTPPLGDDEIGQLARSFDHMRQALKDSLAAIAGWNRELEDRVGKRTRELEVLYQELRRKEEMRGELLKKVIAAQEEERKRIARELHDETSQASAALLLAIEASTQRAPDEAKERLRRMKAMAGRILDSIHRLIFDLRPSMLDDLGLVSALRASAESHLEPLGMDVAFEVSGAERRLPAEIETTLFRIGQEAISNIRRHAEAESVKITVEFGEQCVALRVQDDGKGFNADELERSPEGVRGLGLLGMRERALLLDGALTITSAPGKGSEVSARIPLTRSRT